jgi:hypothetical protein
MSQAEIQYIYEVGYITLRRVRGDYWPDKLADRAALVGLWGCGSFTEEEYDQVLFAAGAPPWGLGLAVIEDD